MRGRGRTRARSRLVALLVALGLAVAGLTLTAAPAAHAEVLDGLCQQAPAPVRPDYQVAGLVMEKPDLATVPDVAPDPFVDHKVAISDVYGWAWRWTNYDLGCGNDFIRDPNAVVNTSAANFMIAQIAAAAAVVQSLEHMARDLDIGWLVTVLKSAADKVGPVVLGTGLPIGVIVVGVIVGLTSLRANYAETMRRLLIVAGCIAAAVFTLVFPVAAARQVDAAAQGVAKVAQTGFSTQASDLMVRDSLYPTWLAGNFGSVDSPVAQEYGPRLLGATTYTWSDVKRMDRDPAAKAAIDKAKSTEFKQIADDVKKKDPAAYAALTGRDDTRTSAALMGGIWVAIMGFFAAVAGLVLVLGRLIMLAMVVVTPLATVIGVVKFSVLQRLWDLFAAAVVNIAKFTVAAGVMTLLLSGIQAAPVGTGWKLLLTVALTVIAVMVTKPVRSFKPMAGLNPDSSVISGLLKRAASTGLGFVAGRDLSQRSESQAAEGARPGSSSSSYVRQVPVDTSMPALPPPPGLTAVGVAPVARSLGAGSGWEQRPSAAGWAGAEAFAVSGGRPSRAALEAGPVTVSDQRTDGVLAQGQVPGAVVVGQAWSDPVVATRQQVTAPAPTESRHHWWSSQPVTANDSRPSTGRPYVVSPAEAAAVGTGVAAGTVGGGGAVAGRPTPVEPGHRLASVTGPQEVVMPSGIIVDRDQTALRRESNLYRSGRATNNEEYLRLSEPQLDATGAETYAAVYRSDRLSQSDRVGQADRVRQEGTLVGSPQ